MWTNSEFGQANLLRVRLRTTCLSELIPSSLSQVALPCFLSEDWPRSAAVAARKAHYPFLQKPASVSVAGFFMRKCFHHWRDLAHSPQAKKLLLRLPKTSYFKNFLGSFF
jgi:hypothetical protein